MAFINKIIKDGKSKAIVLPANLARELDIQWGDYCLIFLYHDDYIVIKKMSEQEVLELKPPTIDIEEIKNEQ